MSQTTDLPPPDSLFEFWDYSAPACAHRRQLALDNLSFLCSDTCVTIVTFKDAGGSWRAIPISDQEPFNFPELSSSSSNTCSTTADEAISMLLQATQRAISARFQQPATFHAVPGFRGSVDGMGYDTASHCVTAVEHGYRNELFTPTLVAPESSNLEDISVAASGQVSLPANHWGCFPTSTAHENIPQAYWTKSFEYQPSEEEWATEYNSNLAICEYTETNWSYGLVPYPDLIEYQELEQCELDAEVFAMIYYEPCREWDLELYEDSETWMMALHEAYLVEEYEHRMDRDYEDRKCVDHRRRVRPSEKRTHCYLDRPPCEAENECLHHREARLFSEYLEAREALTAATLRTNRPEAEQLHDSLLAYERSENPLCEPLSRDYFFNFLNTSKEERRPKHFQEWMQAQETVPVTTEAAELHANDTRPDGLAQHTRRNELPWAETNGLNPPGFRTIRCMWDANSLARDWGQWTTLRRGEMRQSELEDAVRDGRKGEKQSKFASSSQTEDCPIERVSAKVTVAAMTAEEPGLVQSQDDTRMEDVNNESDGTMAGTEELSIRSPPNMSCGYEHGYYTVTPPSTLTVPFAAVLQIDSPQSPCESESTYCMISPQHSP